MFFFMSRFLVFSPVPTSVPVAQAAVLAGESIPVPLWTSPQGGQVHYADAATEAL